MASYTVPLILLALAASSCSASRLERVGLRGQRTIEDKPKEDKEPFDSKMVKGPDCGHLSTVIGKYTKSAKVGQLVGQASGAVTAADKASDYADMAAAKTKDMAKAAEEVGGGAFKAAEDAAKGSRNAGKDATSASTDLQSQIDRIKTTLEKHEGMGFKAKDGDIVKLKKLKGKAEAATKKAMGSAENSLKRGKSAREEAMKNAGAAAKIIEGVTADVTELVKEADDLKQKATWAAEAAAKDVDKAKDVAKKVDKNLKDAGDQKPVWEALKENLDAEIEGTDKAAGTLEDKIKDMEKATKEVESKAKPLEEAQEKAKTDGDMSGLADKSKDINKTETATQALTEAIAAVKAEAATVMKRQKSLGKIADEAAAKKVNKTE